MQTKEQKAAYQIGYNRLYYKKHKVRMDAYGRVWLQKNRAKVNERHRIRTRERREETLAYYGGECFCCKEIRLEFLAIDHINGGGHAQRKERKYGNLALWLHTRKFPKGYRVLCHNCNQARGAYGYCPHSKEVKD